MKKIKRISLIFIAFIMCVTITGCSAFSLFNSTAGAKAVVKQFLSAVAKDDIDKARNCLLNPSDYESLTSIARNLGMDEEKTKKFAEKYTDIDYSIEKTVKGSDSNKATVMVFMTIPDYSSSFAEGLSETTSDMTSNQALKIVVEKMADSKPESVKKAVAIAVVKSGDDWLIDYSNNNIELLNAINGNVLNALHGSLTM